MKSNCTEKLKKTESIQKSLLAYYTGIAVLLMIAFAGHAMAGGLGGLPPQDEIQMELVMNLVVTCSDPIMMGLSKDGDREVWPIVGGRFAGPNIKGKVVPGGADYAVGRSGDGVWEIDALYRLLTDDGVTIIIHNYGIWIGGDKYRLTPEFWAPEGKYDWLNKGRFVCTLTYPVPKGFELARGKHQNDRLLQVYRVY